MRIHQIGSVFKTQEQKVNNKKMGEISQKKDRADFSTKAKDFQYALELAKNIPDVRIDKVEEIKTRIQDKTYTISPEAIAKKMLKGW